MWIVTKGRIDEWMRRHPDAAGALQDWYDAANRADWKNIGDVRRLFRHADAVKVKSGRIVTVFNIRGNHYRLLTAIHYNHRQVFAMRFLTHREYDADRWKEQL